MQANQEVSDDLVKLSEKKDVQPRDRYGNYKPMKYRRYY